MAHRTDEANGMSEIRSFIIRIWLEEMGDEILRPRWHGQITDVRSGDQHYIKNLNEIQEFIQTRLQFNGEN